MRVEKFDDELIAALRTLGFEIADDKESAEIDTEVSIIRPEGSKEFWLQVQFPNDARHALRFNISAQRSWNWWRMMMPHDTNVEHFYTHRARQERWQHHSTKEREALEDLALAIKRYLAQASPGNISNAACGCIATVSRKNKAGIRNSQTKKTFNASKDLGAYGAKRI